MRARTRRLLAIALLAAVARAAGAEEGGVFPDALPGQGPPPDPALTGEQIYERVVANRFRSSIQDIAFFSSDSGGSEQETRIKLIFENWKQREGANGTLSKTKIIYEHPFEVRFTTYLIIDNRDRPNDQFIYLNSRRRVRRVNLRGENLFGTDFSFEDVVPKELEDSTYTRKPDATVQGVPVYVVEAIPKTSAESDYSKILIHVETQNHVPIEVHYWDTAGVEVKRLWAERDSIQQFGKVWMPLRATMRHLLRESQTRLRIDNVVPDPDLPKSTFDVRRLETH
jgi:outer membrane lipoprotein-sorting protein